MLSLIFLSSCAERESLAPVKELKWQPFNPHQSRYTVQRSDTLYAIAFRFDKDYRELALANHLSSPYTLHEGQVLAIRKSSAPIKKQWFARVKKSIFKPRTSKPKQATLTASKHQDSWLWPVKGKIITAYNPQQRSKGINISSYPGAAVRAARSGVVAYAGNGLAGYGNLIIIKHNEKYLSAYAYNKNIKVKEGQKIKAGQIIADIGKVDRNYWGVHFEIRKAGQPVNPMFYLNNLNKKA